MYKLNLWLHVALFLVAGALLMFLGTPYLYEALLPPLEGSARQTERALVGELIQEAEESIRVAAALASSDEAFKVLTAPAPTEAAPLAEATVTAAQQALTKPEHEKLGRVAFAALVNKDGAVLVRGGAADKLDESLAGVPVVRDSLAGRALDGLLRAGDLFRVAAHPVYNQRSVVGVVLVAWPVDQAYFERVAKVTGLPVMGVIGDQVVGSIEGFDPALAKDVKGPGAAGTLQLSIPGPLPLFVTDKTRFITGQVQLAPRSAEDARFVYAVDRQPQLETLAQGQAAVALTTAVLAILMMISLWGASRSIKKPMDLILDHLGKYKQGQATGLLPVAQLKGPFNRLGKQINMILEAPPLAGGPRASVPPLAPPGSVPQTPSEGVERPMDAAMAPPVDDGELQPVAEALVSDEFKQSAISSLFDEASSDPLQAFRVPGSDPGAAAPPPTPPGPPPADNDPLGLMGGAPPPVAPEPSAPPVSAPVSAEPAFNRDSTVMVPIPEHLIEKSAAAPSNPGGLPPGLDGPPSDSTMVSQIPEELLAAAAAPQQEDSDEAHYREVYQEFLRVREQCGEDVSQLTYERFVAKLMKNRQAIVEKYHSKSVRFQVYVKQGKAALRAVPVKA